MMISIDSFWLGRRMEQDLVVQIHLIVAYDNDSSYLFFCLFLFLVFLIYRHNMPILILLGEIHL